MEASNNGVVFVFIYVYKEHNIIPAIKCMLIFLSKMGVSLNYKMRYALHSRSQLLGKMFFKVSSFFWVSSIFLSLSSRCWEKAEFMYGATMLNGAWTNHEANNNSDAT